MPAAGVLGVFAGCILAPMTSIEALVQARWTQVPPLVGKKQVLEERTAGGTVGCGEDTVGCVTTRSLFSEIGRW